MRTLFTKARFSAVVRAPLGMAFLALAGTLSLPPAAQAQQCTFDPSYATFGGVAYVFTGSQATAPGFQCKVGDKTFTNFSGKPVSDDLQFVLSTANDKHFVQVTGTFDPGTLWDLSFDVAALGPTISEISTYAGSNFTGRMDLKLMSMLMDGPVMATYMEDFGMPADPSTPASITPNAQTLSLMATLEVDPSSLASADTWTQTITQTPGLPVPGPLPLLGAGAAFGFTRRLRRRVAGRS
ncbi:MAG: hypothetical protein VKN83_06875 [Cyanobacteriota bacterium]|nr:hypothetical protein [Cyanobacteriota bacterium]